MKLIKANTPKAEYSYGSPDELSDWDVKDLENAGVDVAAYWYSSGSYEGSGNIIFRTPEGWRHHNMGHCSCNGPLDGFLNDKPSKTLKELSAKFSDDLSKETETIFKALSRYH